jgi:hypothetical protein
VGSAFPDPARDAEWDRLTTALQRYGIRHVAPAHEPDEEIPSDPTELFLALSRSQDVRLREATIPLLLTYPEFAADAQAAIARLDSTAGDKAMRHYVAAAALQRMWRTRLALDLGPQPLIPAAYLEDLALPPLDGDFGRDTLVALAAQEEARYGYDAWAGYTSLMDLVLNEIGLRGWGRRHARAG